MGITTSSLPRRQMPTLPLISSEALLDRAAGLAIEASRVPIRLVLRTLLVDAPGAPLAADSPEIRRALRAMSADPTPLARPVIVLAGYRAWHANAAAMRRAILNRAGGERTDVLAVSYMTRGRLTEALRIARRSILKWNPEVAAGRTPVDIVGISMGGLMARELAIGDANNAPLDVRRLFTLATPHCGARLAERISPDPLAAQLQPGSDWLGRLDDHLPRARFELIPYAVLNDSWVGADRTAPPGVTPIWTAGTRVASHFAVSQVPGIIADIAARLRNEAPLAGPPVPLPDDERNTG
jgi:pimeloyl-ACP methyl ester carboxylesterase